MSPATRLSDWPSHEHEETLAERAAARVRETIAATRAARPSVSRVTPLDVATCTVDELASRRWREGRAAHGLALDDPTFRGDPRLELLEELLDAINYARRARWRLIEVVLYAIARAVMARMRRRGLSQEYRRAAS